MGGRQGPKTVAVKGLDEFRRELRKLDDAGLLDDLKDVNYSVAELVVEEAQRNASTRLQRLASESLSPSRQAARAQVTGGGANAPYFGGAEFGSQRGQRRTGPSGRRFLGHNQFDPWRGNGSSAGYFLYPAIRDNTERIIELYGDEMDRITKKAFPDG